MVLITEQVSPKSLNFAHQQKVVMLRDKKGMAWHQIVSRVRNLQNKKPSRQGVINVYNRFSKPANRVRYQYAKCGRKAWKLTEDVKKHLLHQLIVLRKKTLCTSTTLQQALARDRHVTVEASVIRKFLLRSGYRWLPRAQKRKYAPDVIEKRLAFARLVVALSVRRLRERLSLAMDGVVIGVPPKNQVERENHCLGRATHMYRKPGETACRTLAGHDAYDKQVPLHRALPMWGGVSAGGFAEVLMHEQKKKVSSDEWAAAVDRGNLRNAIRQLKPVKRSGPWIVLSDNESFLRAPPARRAHRRSRVTLWAVPPKSPDLNPVEKFWAWLRRRLLAKDLDDLVAKRAPLDKTAYRQRVRSICRSKRAQRVAANCAKGLRKVCQEVIYKQGAATRG